MAMAKVEQLRLDAIETEHMDKHLPYLLRPHDPLCTPPLSWKQRFAHEALEWYNKNKAHNSFAHYKMLTTMMANKVHYKDEYYCHVNFVAVDTVCGRTICELFFAEVKLSQDAQNNEILACCILSPQAWTGCLFCASTMEILHPPPSEYNVGTPVSDDVSSRSLSLGVTNQIYEDYIDGKTPSMEYAPLQRCFIGRKYRDDVEGAEIRACLEDHFMKTVGLRLPSLRDTFKICSILVGKIYSNLNFLRERDTTYVKFLSCESIAPDHSFWRHYNFLAKRADMSNAELEVLFAEKLFERQAGAYPDAPASVCCSLGPAKLVPVERNSSQVGDFYEVTIPGYRRGIDARECFCPVRHPGPDLYTMHRKRPPFYQAPFEAIETQAPEVKAKTPPPPLVSELDATVAKAEMRQLQLISSLPPMPRSPPMQKPLEMGTSSDAELNISRDRQAPSEDAFSNGSAKRKKVDAEEPSCQACHPLCL